MIVKFTDSQGNIIQVDEEYIVKIGIEF